MATTDKKEETAHASPLSQSLSATLKALEGLTAEEQGRVIAAASILLGIKKGG